MNNINGSERLRRIREFLNSVEISYSKSSDGRSITAYTTKEPLFCFERSSIEELKPLLVHTLVSYLLNFFDATKVDVDIESTTVTEEAHSALPVEKLTPFLRGKPILRELEPA